MGNRQQGYERTATELIAALRGRRSYAGLSRLVGYRSNIVQRWESGYCFPPTSVFLRLQRRLKPRGQTWLERFFHVRPDWAVELDPRSRAAVAAFLRYMKGKTPTLRWAELTGYNRYGLGRWLSGQAEPRLPDFLHLVDVSSRRLPDLVAAFVDPQKVPSVRERWTRLEQARAAGYADPWSHAVLRALEIECSPRGKRAQERFVARRLGISPGKVEHVLQLLEASDQIVSTRTGYRPTEVTTIDTGTDPHRARAVKEAWLKTALERMRDGRDGHFGYSLFAVSETDLERLHALHMSYVRAMQELIASSAPAERVGLYCAQLLDLGE